MDDTLTCISSHFTSSDLRQLLLRTAVVKKNKKQNKQEH